MALRPKTDEYYMGLALREAQAALRENEVPVGAIIAYMGRVIGKAHNQRERLCDPTAHAEILAITQAATYLHNWRLNGCTMYVTVEPCAMCAGALVLARVGRLVYGTTDPKAGACGSVFNILNEPRLNHRIQVDSGVCAEDCARLLQEFFRSRRSQSETVL